MLTLKVAGVYNLLWGAWVILFPGSLFAMLGMEQPLYPGIWQCVGMIVGVYGVGYWIAASNPARHWPIVLVGFLGKLFGPIGLIYAVAVGELPLKFGIVNIPNDLIWWFPFVAILWYAFRENSASVDSGRGPAEPLTFEQAIDTFQDQHGKSLRELSNEKPVLLTFLRHSGCTFCREALDDLAKFEQENAAVTSQPVIVHMSDDKKMPSLLKTYGLEGVSQISDPNRVLYRAFELERGGWPQLFGRSVWWRGFSAAILHRHGLGPLDGDGFQMPGVFLLKDGEVMKSFRHATAADRVDYANFSEVCPVENEEAPAPVTTGESR
ncbi:hypothetical protein V22_12200 [Calycomorphotria hydatis]|uniref:Alkyl hydroperoxide reductase subunit C/ Thiol specific antioxidant domain-containing protein n=2 Tax=Calycomorphotria hydatis TaxID=2528027 RepID=A0A517T6K0_9PLAN|nr:hypothetical protein V22_12200 [Calycomorphotria hydatis]